MSAVAQEVQGWIGKWSPQIGDPTVFGWLTVLAYLFAAGLALRAARRSRAIEGEATGPRSTWLLLAIGFVLLGINKQLDLQSALTETGRVLARRDGWYEHRRTVQLAFIAAVLAVGATVVGLVVWWSRTALRRMWVALLGTALVVTFVLVRAASFHRVDAFLGERVLGLRWNWLLELGGISITALGAWRYAAVTREPPE